MKRLVFAVLASVCAFACAEAAIYLKSDATGAADGTSWSNAYTNWNTALTALNAIPDGGDRTLLIARGTYNPANELTDPPTVTLIQGTGFVIRGGYRAQEDGDQERDVDAYPTIFTKVTVNSIKWKHAEINPETGAIVETTTAAPMFVNNIFQPHPDYTGDYDIYWSDFTGFSGIKPMSVAANASGTIDGLYFVGFAHGTSPARNGVLGFVKSCGENWVSNCTFICNRPCGSVIYDAGAGTAQRHISKCRFLVNGIFSGFSSCINSSGNTIVEDCVFEGNRPYSGLSAPTLVYSGGAGSELTRCTFVRNWGVEMKSAYPSAAIGMGNWAWKDCVLSRNVAAKTTTEKSWAPVLVSLVKTGNNTGEMRNCVVADNLLLTTLEGDGNGYNLIGLNNGATNEGYNDSSPLFADCLFARNRIVGFSNKLNAGTTAYVGILGNAYVKAYSAWMSVVGCSFVSNSVEYAAGVEGSSVVVSRGVAINSTASLSCQAGVANCTFLGPADGTPDFRQNGVHTQVSTLLNCVFTTEDPNAVLSPFASDSPAMLDVIDCAAENMYPELQPSNLRTLTGLVYDHIPVKEVAAGSWGNRTLVPTVKVPDIRSSADVSPNATRTASAPASYAYRLKGTDAWLPLVSKLGTGVTKAGGALADALGNVRTQGATTRGAVQALDGTAENGANLVLRRSPVKGGTLSSPANQAVATGAAISPVTATAENSFAGWYDADDKLVSSDNPLVIDSLSSDLVLTAKFASQQYKVIFDLGEHGTFAETGTGTTVVKVSAHSPFPAVPAFTVEDGWQFVSWPAFPDFVEEDGVVYAAKIVTKAKRTFYVAPEARGTGDGSSPENATADFAAAYEDAGAYLGEVRAEGGTYILAATLRIRSNVTVIGEEGATVVFTGDTLGDDVWKAGDTTGKGAVWTDGAFNEPNPDGADQFWTARSTDSADNTRYGFLNSPGETATNAVFRNVTFTGFARSALRAETEAVDGLVLDGCRFLANGTERNSDYAALDLVTAASVTITNCAFTGNYAVYRTTFSRTGNTNVISRCSFTANTGTVLNFTLGVHTNLFDVSGCTFTRNYANSSTPAILNLTGTAHLPGCRIADCAVADTRAEMNCININVDAHYANGSAGLTEASLTVERCSFTGTQGKGPSSSVRGFIVSEAGSSTAVYFWCAWVNCRFADNVCTNTGNSCISLCNSAASGWNTFLGCTFENNEIVSTHANGCSAVITVGGVGGGQNLFGSVFARNRVVAPMPERIGVLGDFRSYINVGGSWSALNAISCVFDEDALPPVCTSKAEGSAQFRNCAIANSNAVLCATAPIYTDCYQGSAGVKAASTVGPNGVRSLGLQPKTPCRKTGVPIWRTEAGRYYWYDKTDASYKSPGGSVGSLSTAQAAELGIGIGYPAVPDAFGASRKVKVLQDEPYGDDPRTAPGPLNPDPMGLLLIVR